MVTCGCSIGGHLCHALMVVSVSRLLAWMVSIHVTSGNKETTTSSTHGRKGRLMLYIDEVIAIIIGMNVLTGAEIDDMINQLEEIEV